MSVVTEDSPHFGVRTTIRVSPLGFIQGESISTSTRSNSVSLLGAKIDEWGFDGCFDSLPETGETHWGTNERVFNGFWAWAAQLDGRDERTCLITGGPGSGERYLCGHLSRSLSFILFFNATVTI